ncbi:uncharacterized protein B0I36DRAFT_318006 [Microdochium trichocladiopsis]|uniref:Pentatricopeptide repeat protein n=1 Tax=Microdochium trichocladiopsis TaxID=1682393 RepID=A0A9P8Y941_9PEZI|nr:uncharacterized protein B0I36DRAFT_318006 [Microdochium trichocladiopsis]KAH7035269.1 hypothetical protein B0I36DRAFT_318006 [Microdochium trichocladiopsis]
MTPPIPVPSKAAIRALRGLALGTSCAIGAIVEDRRRRISTLQTAVSNKEKLQSARRYRSNPDEAASWLPFDEDAVAMRFGPHPHDQPLSLDDLELPARRRVDHSKKSKSEKLPALNEEHTKSQSGASQGQQDIAPSASQRKSSTRRKPVRVAIPPQELLLPPGTVPSLPWGLSSRTTPGHAGEGKVASLIEAIQAELNNEHDKASIDRAVAEFLRGCQLTNAYESNGPAWKFLSARLAKECQKRGKWEHALAIINVALRPDAISRDNFRTAVRLFNTVFPESPHMHSQEVHDLGEELITLASRMRDVRSMESVYWRVLSQSNDGDFVGWFIKSLFDLGDHKRVIKYFLLNYAKMTPSFQGFQDTVDCVVQAVEKTSACKVGQVLQALARMQDAADGKLRSRWIMRLLHAHWKRHEDFTLSQALFEDVRTQGLLDRTAHPQGSYRAIIEFALRADEEAQAQQYLEEVTRLFPAMCMDIPIQGYFALRKARAGDWAATEEMFAAMRRSSAYKMQQAEYSMAFVPVLKEFSRKNCVGDVRLFLDKYTSHLAVKLNPWMMTVVANKYGEVEDRDGFFEWFEYCFDSGVTLDASFCNVILDNSRTRWRLSYWQLQKLSNRMRALHPDSYNAVTRRILRAAATSSTTGTPRPIRHKELAVDKRTLAGRPMDAREAHDAMSHHLANGKPAAALFLYQRASSYGMPHSERCLRLAVIASFHKAGGHKVALDLIQKAHESGRPVTSAATAYLKYELDRVRGSPEKVFRHMQRTVHKFEALQIDVEPKAYANSAITCIKLGQHDRALLLCKLAMEKAGTTNPCFSRQTFRALLMLHTQTLNVDGLKELISAIPQSKMADERNTMDQLKSVRRHVQNMTGNDERRTEIRAILQSGIDSTKAQRANIADHSAAVSAEALRIMNDAVVQFEKFKQMEEKARTAAIELEREDDERPDSAFYMMRYRIDGDTKRLGYRISGRQAPQWPSPRDEGIPVMLHHDEDVHRHTRELGAASAAAAAN